MTVGAACFLILLTAFPGAAISQQSEEVPAAVAPVEDPLASQRQALIAPGTEQPARVNAAINLAVQDLPYLTTQLVSQEQDQVVLAVLGGLQIKVTEVEAISALVPELLRLTIVERGEPRGEIPVQAALTLRLIDQTWKSRSRPLLEQALVGEDAALARAAVRALALTRDLAAVKPLFDLLERTAGKGKLAEAAGAALGEILGVDHGTDLSGWKGFWKGCAGKSRDVILEEVLAMERDSHAQLLVQKDLEIIRLRREKDASDPMALTANLDDPLPGVRRFSAELLVRGAADWDLQPARPILLRRLAAGGEPPAVVVPFLQLLLAVELQGKRLAPDPERDALIVTCLQSDDPRKVEAALAVAEQLPVAQISAAVLRILNGLDRRPLSADARLALVKACESGKLGLRAGRDRLVTLMQSDPSIDVRKAAVSTLGSLAIPDTREPVATVFLEDADWRVRRRAAAALARIAGKEAIDTLIRGLEDDKQEVRSEVVNTLSGQALEPGDQRIEKAFIERYSREDVLNVRTGLVKALGQMAGAAALPVLIEAARSEAPSNGSGMDQAHESLRQAALASLTAIAGDDLAAWDTICAGFQDRPELCLLPRRQRVRLLEGGDPAALLAARVELAAVAFQVDDHDLVIEVSTAGLEAAPDGDVALRSRLAALSGRSSGKKGDHKTAAAQLEQALLLGGLVADERNEVLTLAARELNAAGDGKQAIALLGKQSSLTADQLLLLARLEKGVGLVEESRKHYRDYLGRSAGANPGQEFQARLELAESLLDGNDVNGAALVLPAALVAPEGSNETAKGRLEALRKRIAAARAPAKEITPAEGAKPVAPEKKPAGTGGTGSGP